MAKVYWCARDLAGSPVGNHHLLLVLLGAGESIPPFDAQTENGQRFVTLAGFKKDGRLQFGANDENDVQAVREYLNPAKHLRWWYPDFDLEAHEITPPSGTALAFAQRLARLAENYRRNEATRNQPYDLNDENCAAWVNTILKVAGVSSATRIRLGEFNGVDWGEEDPIDETLFA